MYRLSETGFVDLPQILGQREVTEEEAKRNRLAAQEAKRRNQKPKNKPRRARKKTRGLIPVGKSTWWDGVRSGRFPQPVKLGRRTLWRVEDIRALIEQLTSEGGGR